MKRSNLSNALALIGIGAYAVCGCGKNPLEPEIPPPPPDHRTYSFQVLTSSSSPISGATACIRTSGRQYSGTTDQKGSVTITIENGVALPNFVVVTVDQSSVLPGAVTVPGDEQCIASRTVTCKPFTGKFLVKAVTLHHLGDDHYTGPANSKLQIPSEGIRMAFQFSLPTIPSLMPSIRLFARGVQYGAKIRINGTQVSSFNNSPANGDLTIFEGRLSGSPSACLKKGTNSLELETGYDASLKDYDDIEFCSLVLYQ